MPGREDYAIVRARLLSDPRTFDVADGYVKCGIALEPTSKGAVVGHVAMLAVWATRETNDGVLPGDGVATTASALSVTRSDAAKIVEALRDGKLLRRVKKGLYIVGFKDCYSGIRAKRKADRERLAEARSVKAKGRSDVAATSQRHRSDVARTSQPVADLSLTNVASSSSASSSSSERSENPPVVPPEPPNGHGTAGGSASPLSDNGHGRKDEPQPVRDIIAGMNGAALDPGEIAGILAACGAIINRKDIDPDFRARAKRVNGRVREGTAPPAETREWIRSDVYPRDFARIAYLGAKGGAR